MTWWNVGFGFSVVGFEASGDGVGTWLRRGMLSVTVDEAVPQCACPIEVAGFEVQSDAFLRAVGLMKRAVEPPSVAVLPQVVVVPLRALAGGEDEWAGLHRVSCLGFNDTKTLKTKQRRPRGHRNGR